MTDFNCDTEFGTASFAGVEFEILPSDHSGGRRILTHEYPFKDDHYNEDLGDKPNKWSVKGLFVGEGWRDRFTEAKQKWRKSGAAEFFEPTENATFEAVLVDWSFSLDSKRLNAVEFTLELVEKGLEPYFNLESDWSGEIVATAAGRYISKLRNWYVPRFDLYDRISEVFRGYDAVRGYVRVLSRQFLGLGSLVGVTGALDAMEPTRSGETNFTRATDVFEAAAQGYADGGTDPTDFYRAASEVRLTGEPEAEDQALMVAGIALGYHFEAVADDATYERIAEFRTRAEALKAAANDPALTGAVDALISALGRAASPACTQAMSGQWNALVASYELYGDVSRAGEIMALSGGVSGAAMNGITYPCPA